MWKNTSDKYGLTAVLIHWLSALIIFGLFALGWWMLTLTYYDEWYRLGPWWHKSFGITLLIVTVLRVFWTLTNTKPKPLGSKFERLGAKAGHFLLYLLLFTVMISGFLISTADGSSISVFDWFSVPAVITDLPKQEDIAGDIHWYSALSLVILAGGHGLAALKHHFINRDSTLIRMFGKTKRKS
ncbi:cytochrome b [Idiomarina loihiensis]|jgi:cytochrome b561|uniref:Cytochrome B561 n=1 Tax=Idiomarina loihiensis (strain ATCC BAA-735 / DSM 15497 / L2-TR) TaxID=283942 RepID=Q5QUT4_IDILO|nr:MULTISPECIES: cytochrome b [Idiomarina]MAA62097.1 cytochrome b [Idiomarina sp.]AAV83395.1 Cytochrome B561 [Idiomarina loihiensis L2TR]AGM37438.1 cytochrome B561 [Idiomarina loihiensis GSL 199]PWW38600.1 cytochrome b561 [Idiomarina loihiensis]TDO46427.1 cytochrome b561 [Idiomarina sp. 017G]|tara:strand:- start:163 stop:714 length:552 start_codon:yes stop_codon:yes gene_type:complete